MKIHPRTQHGVGLVEVMVAVAILAFGMLGIAALQATALRSSQSSLERSEAVMKTYAILDAMRANRDAAMIGAYNMGAISADYEVTAWACGRPDAGDLAANDRRQWVGAANEPGSLKATLGASACTAIRCLDAECIVAVRWDDSRATGGDDEQELMTRTRI
ncbi:MAG: type IV pilus modification protein PilV [Pseudomonadota bacterium]|nr:type IV pilus modification protein PilV [Pseudomonadota bacterium]